MYRFVKYKRDDLDLSIIDLLAGTYLVRAIFVFNSGLLDQSRKAVE